MSQTRRTLAGVAGNPNVGAVLVVGLGCETNQARAFAATIPTEKPIEVIGIQELGGSDVTTRSGVRIAEQFVQDAQVESRVSTQVSGLTVGILGVEADDKTRSTVYPVLGRLVDGLTQAGAGVIVGLSSALAPAGASLAERAADGETGERLRQIALGLDRKRWQRVLQGNEERRPWTESERKHALAELALTGESSVAGVGRYSERTTGRGLHMMTVPSNPVEAMAGLVAGGANVIIIGSSRGLFSGAIACPTLVVAPASERMSALDELVDWRIENADPDVEAGRLLRMLLDVASGRETTAEAEDLGDFAISQVGTPF